MAGDARGRGPDGSRAPLDAPLRETAQAGLNKVFQLGPSHGWAEVGAEYSTRAGVSAFGEVGAHLLPNVGLYGRGEWDPVSKFSASAGARITW